MKKIVGLLLLGVAFYGGYVYGGGQEVEVEEDQHNRAGIDQLVRDHARAWETGDKELFLSTIHDDIVFAYPGRRLNYDELVEDFDFFAENFTDTKVYIHNIIVEGDMVGVEWQYASTNSEGKRTAVSDGIIGEIKDGKILSWKEYLDGRVSRMQLVDELPLEEGEEPFPWPRKPQES